MKSYTKRLLSLLLSVMMVLSCSAVSAFAEGEGEDPAQEEPSYAGKIIVLYTGNLRGDIDNYDELATAKADFAAKGADAVYLVDAGNYMQGTRFANSDRGNSIYELMDAAGYDVAAMGAYEFVFGNGGVGNPYHAASYKKFESQKELAEDASFTVISSNLNGPGTTGNYSFVENKVFGEEKKIAFVAQTDENTPSMIQDDWMAGCEFKENITRPTADVVVGLSNNGEAVEGATVTISAPTTGVPANADKVIGAYEIDLAKNTATPIEDFDLKNYSSNAKVARKISKVKAAALPAIGTSKVMLNGSDTANWQKETNLGDLTADAYLWYAENKFEGFKKDVPVVAIQNGGNCDQFLYPGDVTEVDLFNALPFSPFGMGIIYVSGEQLLTALEAGTSPSGRYSSFKDDRCPGFAQVAGMTYNVDFTKEYDAGEAYGYFNKANSINRATLLRVGDEAFDPAKTYAVITDNNLIGNNRNSSAMDTYYVFNEARDGGNTNISNGSTIWENDIVEMYIKDVLGGVIGDKYAEPQGRITFKTNEDLATELIEEAKKAAEAATKAAEKAKASGSVADAEAAVKAAEAAKLAAHNAADVANKSNNEDLKNEAKGIQEAADKAVNDAKAAKTAADKAAADKAAAAAAEAKAKKVKTVTVNVKTVNAKAIDKAVKAKGGSKKYVTKIILGKKVKKIGKSAFKKYTKVTTLEVKTKKLKKATVKKSLTGSKVKTIKVKVGKKKDNKKYVKKYKKIFTKKNAGKKVKIR